MVSDAEGIRELAVTELLVFLVGGNEVAGEKSDATTRPSSEGCLIFAGGGKFRGRKLAGCP